MSHESNLPAKPSVKVRGWVDPFHPQATAFGVVMAGTTIADAITKACRGAGTRKRYQRRGLVYLGRTDAQGRSKWVRVPQDKWNKIRLKPNDSLAFRLLPTGGGGGKNPLRTILNIVVMAVAVAAAVFTAGSSLVVGALGVTGAQVAGGIVGGVIMCMGQILVNAIAPIRTKPTSISSADSASVYSLSGSSNQIDKWGYVPILFGKGRYAPKKAAAPYTELRGNDMYLHELFIWGECGTGDIQITDLKLGDTPISEYKDVSVETWKFDPAEPYYSNLYPTGVSQEDLSITLTKSAGGITRTSKEGAVSVSVDIMFNALAHYNDRGDAEYTTVVFMVQYRKHTDDDSAPWTTIDDIKSINAASFTDTGENSLSTGTYVYIDGDQQRIRCTNSRYWKRTSNKLLLYRIYGRDVYATQGEEHPYIGTRDIRVSKEFDGRIRSGFDISLEYDKGGYLSKVNVTAGTYSPTGGSLTVGAKSSSAVRRTFNISGLDGVSAYDIRLSRLTDDHEGNDRYQDKAYWTAIRTHTNEKPLNIDYSVVLTALQVKATDQLNGTISNLTGEYEAIMPSYNQENKTWETVATRDLVPAIRFVLQQANARPQPDEVIDFDNLIDADAYWKSVGWKYDKVVDSQTSVLSLLQEICAAGLASPTFIDGKWAVIIDRPRSEVVMGITSANSWGWSVDRVTSELPHYIQCDFTNEESWEADMMEVRTDEVLEEGKAPVYEKVTFDGVTIPDNVYKQARFHYADAKMQVRTISMTMWDESLIATRGDLVALSQPYLIPTGLQAGRVKKVFTDDNGLVYKVTTDVSNNLDPARDLGAKFYLADGSIAHAKISASSDVVITTNELMFIEPITANIQRGDKFVLGDYGEEDFLGVITSMKFNADLSCQITCVDYIEDKYKVFDPDFVVPPFHSNITQTITSSKTLYPAPIIKEVVTDESVLITKGKTLVTRAQFTFGVPDKMDPRAQFIKGAYRIADTGGGVPGSWITFLTNMPISETIAYCDEVEDNVIYDFRFCYVSVDGLTSLWTTVSNVYIEGKTNPPPNVTGLTITKDTNKGLLLSWDPVLALDFDHYSVIGESVGGEEYLDIISPTNDMEAVAAHTTATNMWAYPYNSVGDAKSSVWAADIVGLLSREAAQAVYEIIAPSSPLVTKCQLLDDGIHLDINEVVTSWKISDYTVMCSSSNAVPYVGNNKRMLVPVPSDWKKNDTLVVTSKDIFNNLSEESEPALIQWYPPKTPDIVVGMNKLNGAITLDWQDCRSTAVEGAPSIARYDISGTLANQQNKQGIVSVTGTHYEAVVPLTAYEYGSQEDEDGTLINVGTLYVKVSAIDKYGVSNEDAPDYVDSSVSISIYPPYNPTNMALSASDEKSNIVLTWKDCTRTFAIDYYLVTDEVNNQTYKVSTNYVVLPARKEGTYKITVQAYDVIGHSSAAMEYNMVVSGVGGMTVSARVDGSDILLEWSIPDSSFIIDHYIIKGDNDIIPDEDNINFEDGDTLGTAKVNYFRVPAGKAGTYVYYVWAVDVAGNISTNYASYTTITIDEPSAPTVNATLSGDGVKLNWASDIGESQLPIRSWDVIRQWDELRDDGVTETKEMEYGRLDVDTTNVPAFIAGEHTFLVRAVDSGGNLGPWGSVDFIARKPGKVTFSQPTVIDNNVQLYWTMPNFVFFNIKEYIFSEIETYEDGSEYEAEIGRIDALFASETENESGMYTYGITPVDVGGNIGERTIITCRVSQPPDFVFYDKKESLFNGNKVNMVLDGQGHMLGPVPVNETWEENIARVIELGKLSATQETLTHQQKINAGYKTWLEPHIEKGTYSEIIDHNTIIPSCNYSITLGYRVITGNPTVECKIEISSDNTKWEVASDNALSVFVTQFRYSRFTITVTGGYIEISSILVDLNVKQLTDYGRVECKATDNGDGWVSEQQTPMLTGTWVPFNRDFVDVQSLPMPNVVNHQEYTAFTVFEDVINPKGFRIFVKDKNGSRVTATVDWTAMGV